ncbi:MAG TPA: HAMP domain-containing sensor histidine kinase, partial [Solirubrobacterales bacterium]|nr:HAMP domain-containing sensor histidine kinase [Solirubrobacterales bacterium]
MSARLSMKGPATTAAAVTAVGAVATLAFGAMVGMPGKELGPLALSLLPAVVLSVAAAAVTVRLLAGTSLRRRIVGVVALASVLGLANMIVLASLMYLDANDALHLVVLLLYSAAAAGGAALALSRSTTGAVERLSATAHRLGDGDLDARVGPIDDDPELGELARTLDDMAARLQGSIERERQLEAHRLDMITAASHDLRTPLASLRAMIEALEDGVVPEGDERDRYLHEMGNSVDSLAGLTDDLFELIKLEAGAIEADTDPARLSDVTATALALCEGAALEKGLQVRAALGDAATARCSTRLARVIQNLVQNAIRHTPAEGTVVVRAELSGEGIELLVTDDGEGIPPDAIDKVFEPFWRGEAARSSKGSGLGLT